MWILVWILVWIKKIPALSSSTVPRAATSTSHAHVWQWPEEFLVAALSTGAFCVIGKIRLRRVHIASLHIFVFAFLFDLKRYTLNSNIFTSWPTLEQTQLKRLIFTTHMNKLMSQQFTGSRSRTNVRNEAALDKVASA